MKFTGENFLDAPVEQAWDALLDPAVLVRTIPGCERLEATGENAYAMTVTAGVASIRGTYAGSCELRDLVEHESLVMKLDGAGAPGTIGAPGALVGAFPDIERESTELALVPGDQLLLYTDGVTEGRRGRVMYDDDRLVACAALKRLDPTHAEVKSMRTARDRRRGGVGSRLLAHLIEEARRRGFRRLSLETGSDDFFASARALYAKFGFTECEPFADYRPDPLSVFLTREL